MKPPLTSRMVRTIVAFLLMIPGTSLVAQSSFTDASWTNLQSGVNGPVYALAVSGTKLFVGGFFTTAGGISANAIAQWDGSSWSGLGSGVTGFEQPFVSTLAVAGTKLYAGGSFTNAGAVAANEIAEWDGASWSPLNSGMDGWVESLAVSGGNLYVGGNFTKAGTAQAVGIAQWNGVSWSALGTNLVGQVTALAISGNTLFVGGSFTVTVAGITATNLAEWNGTSWSALPAPNGPVYALAVSGTNLFVGGAFTMVGNFSATNIAEWNGSSWSALGSGISGATATAPEVEALSVSGNNLYSAGSFTTAGTTSSSNVAAAKLFPDVPFTVLHNFTGTSGSIPYAALALVGETFYGTTAAGGLAGNGVIFEMDPSGSNYTVLHNFSALQTHTINSDGADPIGGLVSSGNTLYGTADKGGTGNSIGFGWGTVFGIVTNGVNFTTLHSFTFTGTDGANPVGSLALSGSTLFGVTRVGGNPNVNNGLGYGTIFSGNVNGSGFTTLHSFSGSDGSTPNGDLVLAGSTLYGTSTGGGSSNEGTVFAVNTGGTGFATLHNFSGAEGSSPHAGLLLYSNILYGTAAQGGAANVGTVFSIHTDGTAFTTLHTFTNVDGASPYGTLIASNGTLYGTTMQGGAGARGTVFSIKTDGTAFTVLRAFVYNDGAYPQSGLLLSDNVLYGTTESGGANGGGVIFSLSPIPTPPYITSEPYSLVVTDSYPAIFNVSASGPPAIVYEWEKDGIALTDGPNISGSRTNTLTIKAAGLSDAGQYQAIITNGFGAVTSAIVSLTVLPFPPEIQSQPQPASANVVAGTNRVYSIAAVGAGPLSYQWYFNGVAVAGAVAPSLQLQNVTTNQTGSYTVVITNSFGSITSSPAVLNVFTPAAITGQSTNISTVNGVTETLNVVANGTALQYQWFFGSTAITGATNSSLTLANIGNANAGTYYVLVSNAISSIKSQPISVSVYTALRIFPTTQTPFQNFVGYWPNVPMTYTINVGPPAGTTSYVVQDQFSVLNNSNFTYSVQNISSSGHFDAVHGIVKWVFLDGNPRTLTYQIVPGDNATNWMQFSGLVSINGRNTPIAGDSRINLLPLHPADNTPPIASQLNISDMETYRFAFLTGSSYPVEPSLFTPAGIPPEYVSKATSLYQGGENYYYNPASGNPPNCWVNTNPPVGTMLANIRLKSTSGAGGAHPLDNSQSTAVCSMANVYTDSVPFTVTVLATPATDVVTYAVEDQVPIGWAVTNIFVDGAPLSGQALFDSYTHKVKWGPFDDNIARTLTYQITPPPGVSGLFSFLGITSFDGPDVPITGVRQISSGVVAPPGITGMQISGANLTIDGTNPSSGTYSLMTSTNLSLPFNEWIPITTNTFNSSGNFSITATNVVTPGLSKQFYILKAQ
jgi:uncharacterized repeat protein (TIGR03803 family)